MQEPGRKPNAARAFSVIAAVLIVALGAAGCQVYQQQQAATQKRLHEGNIIIDRDRILMSTGGFKLPYRKLGELTYTEPLSPDAIEGPHINQRLRKIAIAKWGREVDAIIHINSKIGANASTVTVTAEAIQVTGNCSFCRHNHASPKMQATAPMPIPD
jgi:hypothetical protein